MSAVRTSNVVAARHRPPTPSLFAGLAQPAREAFVASVILLGAGFVTELWWRDARGHLAGAAQQITAAGRVTGLIGTYLVLIGVLFMGRVRWLDNLIGIDRLAIWHRRIGESVAILLVAHTFLTIWGYALAGHIGLLGEAKTVVIYFPDMLLATAGLIVLLVVVITSLRIVRSRLRYETWHFVHLYAYLAIALTFAHQLATGDDFVTHRGNRLVWSLLFVVTLGAFAWHRLAAPIVTSARHKLKVEKIVSESPDVVSIYIGGRRVWELAAEAGQFVRIRFLTRDSWWHAHPFSLSAEPNGRWLRVTARARGAHTKSLAEIPVGVRVVVEGPYGAFTAQRRKGRGALLVAGGIGITPLRSLFEALVHRGEDVVLLYRVSYEGDIVFRGELDRLAQEHFAKVHYLVGHRSDVPLTARRLRTLVPDLNDRDAFVCGPPGMTRSVHAALRAAGVPRRQLHSEGFAY